MVLKWELETVPSASPGGVFGEGGDQYEVDRYFFFITLKPRVE